MNSDGWGGSGLGHLKRWDEKIRGKPQCTCGQCCSMEL